MIDIKIHKREAAVIEGVSSMSMIEFAKYWANYTDISVYKHHPVNLTIVKPTEEEGQLILEMSDAIAERKTAPILQQEKLAQMHDALWAAKNSENKVCLTMTSAAEVLCKMGKVDTIEFGLKTVGNKWYASGTLHDVNVLDTLYSSIELNNAALVLVKDTTVRICWRLIAQGALAALAGGWFEMLKDKVFAQDAWMQIAYSAPKSYDLARSRVDGYSNLKFLTDTMREALDEASK